MQQRQTNLRFEGITGPKRPTRSARRLAAFAQWTVRSISPRATQGLLICGSLRVRCALGRSGSAVLKREGDGTTPIGEWRLSSVLYRSDRIRRPRTLLPLKSIRPKDGWCDAPDDRRYNRAVLLPYPASSEALWRSDQVYDIVIILDYNGKPRRRNAGSAIFAHVSRPGFSPTEGCIALPEKDLRNLLAVSGRHARIRAGL